MGNPAQSYPTLFILGPPRSGTTLTYQVVTQQFRFGFMTRAMNYVYGVPNLAMRLALPYIHRPAPIFVSQYGAIPGWGAPGEGGNFWFRWFPRDGAQGHYVDPSRMDMENYCLLKRNVDSLTAIVGAPIVFKCVYLSMVAGALAQIFPEARFIVVRREMIQTARSILRRRLQQKDPNLWWSVRPPHYRQLIKLALWQQVAEQVFYTEKVVTQDLHRYAKDRYLQVSYEELCGHPRHVVAKLRDWLSPWGDYSYDDMTVPNEFQFSKGVTVPDDMMAKMQDHLNKLHAQAAQ